jgi:peptidoglycan/LPS O-acetylase OafA/YrhL
MIGLLFYTAYPTILQDIPTHKARLVNELLFIQNYNYTVILIGHTWSLAVEEHFYFGLALLFFILAKLKLLDNKLLFNTLTVIILLLCLNMRLNMRLNIVSPKTGSFDFSVYLIPTHLRVDTLWVGVFIAYHYNYNMAKFKDFFGKGGYPWLILVGLSVAICYPLDNKFLATFGLTLIALCFGGTLAALVANDKSEELLYDIFGRRIVKGFAKIGTYSYGIYLFHMMILWYVKPFGDAFNYNSGLGRLNTLVVFLVILGVGILATECIEKPILKWRNRIIK